VFQQFNLLPSLAAWRNVELPLAILWHSRAERRAARDDALEQVGLGDRSSTDRESSPAGKQQRVCPGAPRWSPSPR